MSGHHISAVGLHYIQLMPADRYKWCKNKIYGKMRLTDLVHSTTLGTLYYNPHSMTH